MADDQCALPLSTSCTTFLTYGQKVGLVIAAEIGFASAFAVLFVLGNITIRVLGNLTRVSANDFFRSPMDVYMLSLLISDLLQAVGGILDIMWVLQGSVSCGARCTTQGVIQQLGETGVAMATLAIAVHTFFLICLRKGTQAIRLAFVVVCAIWLYVIIFVTASAATHRTRVNEFYTPTPYWCWIGSRFPAERIAGEYAWLWATAFISLFLYLPVFFRLPGSSREARAMLLYPISYFVLVFPLSVVRWVGFSSNHVPSAATLGVISVYGLSGFVNVTLLVWTRPGNLFLNSD